MTIPVQSPAQQNGARFARSPRMPSLPPREHTWIRDSICLGSAAVGVGAFAPLTEYAALTVPGAAGLTIASISAAVFGKRNEMRDTLIDEVVEDLCPVVGLPEATRAVLKVVRWFKGWPGIPSKLVVHYDSAQATTDPTWITEISDVFESRGWGFFELVRIDNKKRRLIFAAAEPPEQEQADSDQVIWAKKIVSQLLGPTAKVIAVDIASETGDVTSMEVRHELGAKLASEGYRTRIERGVGATLPGRWKARWNLHTDWVRFEQRTVFPESVWLPSPEIDSSVDLLATYDKVEIPYGIDEDGNEVVWRPAIDPNLMLIGVPGSGKTVTAHNLLVNVTRRGWPVWVLDGKYVEFLGYQDWPNVQVVATTIEQQVALVHRAHELMEFRYQKIVTGEASEADFEPVLVFLDEWAEFRGNVEAWYASVKSKGDPRNPPVLNLLASMARKARTSRVHLVFGTQRPDAIYFVGDMRDNFAMRISMGRLSPQAALMMWQSPGIGISVPRGCRGRGTTVSETYKPIEIQCYRVPDPRKVAEDTFESELLDTLRPTATRHPRLLIVPPTSRADIDAEDDTVQPAPLTYDDYVDAEWVLASDRRDLDPVVKRRAMNRVATDRRLASPTALLGLLQTEFADLGASDVDESTRGEVPEISKRVSADRPDEAVRMLDKLATARSHNSASERATSKPLAHLALVQPPADSADRDYADAVTADDEDDQYGPVRDCHAADVVMGDLLLLDDTDQWVVVDTEPEPDLVEDSLLSLTWRSDDDDVGDLAIPDDAPVSIRKPLFVDLGV